MRFFVGSCVSALAISALFPAAAQAQEPAGSSQVASSDNGLGEIVVTAEKRQSSAQKTAIAIDVLTATTLQKNGVGNIEQLQNVDPAVQFGQANTSTFVAVRGVSSRDGTEIGDPAIAINQDGVFLQRPSGMNASFFDLERIEVLRGPQGTLYGRNATGGVINIISKKPTDDFGGYGSLTVGNYGTLNSEGAINVPVSDGLDMRASFSTKNHSGYRNNASSAANTGAIAKGDDEDVKAGRLQLLWKPTPQFSALLSGTYVKEGGIGPVLVGYPTSRLEAPTSSTEALNFPLGQQGSLDIERKNLSAELNYDFGPVKATYLFGYVGLDITHVFDNDGTDTRFYMFHRGEYSKDYSHEIRLSSTGSGPFQWQIGGYFYDQTLNLSSLNYVNRIANFILRDFEYQVKEKSRAAFGQVSYAITPELKLTAGVRYSADDKTRTGYKLAGPGLGNADLNLVAQPTLVRTNEGAASQSHDRDTSYHFGLDYQVTPRSLLYVKADKGYKSGGFTSLNQYGPEKVYAYEIGSKNRLFGNTLQLNLSAFHYDYRGQQVGQITPQGAQTLNAGKSRVNGVEVQADWKPTPNDALDLSVNWLDAKFTDFAINVAGVNVQQAGHHLIQAPTWSMSAGYEHDFTFGNGGKVTPRIQGLYRSESWFDVFNSLSNRQRPYGTLDLSLTYTAPKDAWSLQVYGRNVTNAVVLTSVVTGSFQGVNMYQFAAPATFGARFQANF